MAVSKDVSCVQQQWVFEPTHSAHVVIRTQNHRSEYRLVHSLASDALGILSFCSVPGLKLTLESIEGHNELRLSRLVADDPDGIDWDVHVGRRSDEPDQPTAIMHGVLQRTI